MPRLVVFWVLSCNCIFNLCRKKRKRNNKCCGIGMDEHEMCVCVEEDELLDVCEDNNFGQ